MTTQLDSYPNRIREFRLARGMTQQELADAIGTSAVHVGHLELGRRELSLSMMRAIAREFDVPTADILSHADNPIGATPRSRRLLTHWQEADEPGRQAIERVAETMVGYRAPDAADIPSRLAPAPARNNAGPKAARKRG